MNQAEQIEHWNRWYDELPEKWRFQVVLWPLLIIGGINMAMTIGFRFPFGLLLVLAIAALACIRAPYALGWIRRDPDQPRGAAAAFRVRHVDWMWRLNTWYNAKPELVRWWLVPVVLIVAGTLNMVLTISARFPFGLLFLIALLFVCLVRGLYVTGLLAAPSPDGPGAAAGGPAQLAHDGAAPFSTEHARLPEGPVPAARGDGPSTASE